ncbi:MAG TPA: flagellar biosynthetic protein FliR [Fervidobacterium sp.]|nr:flagellar biosynthetic protein FliR [Fervidobacterium sp.]HOQ39791.1 flagellar biosynthetic protein FliR [Fervidobacterium sp.]HPP17733.1 flagellar biosynthetic protein FliR [Fervidobacterium sp.]HPT54353.1 flagellar biosynthetic protein FliR [Fervidobacterium sp.]HPZ17610.1 flagellar biosynthetic protein FliR [Fervidobacterium sp.]
MSINAMYGMIHQYALSWGLILSRLTGMMVIAPMFASFTLPTEILVALLVALSYMTLPHVAVMVPITLPLATIVTSLIFNFFIGFFIGLIAYTIASAVYTGSEIFGIQSGFNVSGSLDPTVEESPITSEFIYLMSLYVFVSLKGHILIYEAVIKSVEKFPLVLTDLPFDKLNAQYFQIFLDMFLFSLQIALPIIGLMFLINVLFGVLSRLVPQMNVFMVAMPASTIIMFVVMVGMIPIWVELISGAVVKMEPYIDQLLAK